jgi:hypothetical protein
MNLNLTKHHAIPSKLFKKVIDRKIIEPKAFFDKGHLIEKAMDRKLLSRTGYFTESYSIKEQLTKLFFDQMSFDQERFRLI